MFLVGLRKTLGKLFFGAPACTGAFLSVFPALCESASQALHREVEHSGANAEPAEPRAASKAAESEVRSLTVMRCDSARAISHNAEAHLNELTSGGMGTTHCSILALWQHLNLADSARH